MKYLLLDIIYCLLYFFFPYSFHYVMFNRLNIKSEYIHDGILHLANDYIFYLAFFNGILLALIFLCTKYKYDSMYISLLAIAIPLITLQLFMIVLHLLKFSCQNDNI